MNFLKNLRSKISSLKTRLLGLSKSSGPSVSSHSFPLGKKRISWGEVVDPLIQIKIKTSFGWLPVWFVLDTGADVTVLTVKFAESAGISFERARREKLAGIGDGAVYGYRGKIEVRLNGLSFETRAYFLDVEKNLLLLGRMDLFDKFSLFFDNEKKEVVFSRF